jgi:hypothetical protein
VKTYGVGFQCSAGFLSGTRGLGGKGFIMAPVSCEILDLVADDRAVAAAELSLPLGAGSPGFAVTRR